MDLRGRDLSGELLDPREAFGPIPTAVEVRVDLLTGHSSRLVRGGRLMPPIHYDLRELAERTRLSCPFCPDRIDGRPPGSRNGSSPEVGSAAGRPSC
jgi:hypothetical protein